MSRNQSCICTYIHHNYYLFKVQAHASLESLLTETNPELISILASSACTLMESSYFRWKSFLARSTDNCACNNVHEVIFSHFDLTNCNLFTGKNMLARIFTLISICILDFIDLFFGHSHFFFIVRLVKIGEIVSHKCIHCKKCTLQIIFPEGHVNHKGAWFNVRCSILYLNNERVFIALCVWLCLSNKQEGWWWGLNAYYLYLLIHNSLSHLSFRLETTC